MTMTRYFTRFMDVALPFFCMREMNVSLFFPAPKSLFSNRIGLRDILIASIALEAFSQTHSQAC
jgi:hypothetical protein